MNQQMNKLAASYVDFAVHGMLDGTCIESMLTAFNIFVCYSADELPAVCSKDDDDSDNGDNETVAGPKVLAHVYLAKTICELALSSLLKYF